MKRCKITTTLTDDNADARICVGDDFYRIAIEGNEESAGSIAEWNDHEFYVDACDLMRGYLKNQNELNRRPVRKATIEFELDN